MNAGNEEFLPIAEINKLRQRRWQSQRHYLLKNSEFFSALWDGLKVPHNLADIAELPLSDKPQLRESQGAHPPFGNYLASSEAQIIRLHRTSGTTGHAMNVALTKFDAEQTARIGGRCHRAVGIRKHHRVAHCLNYQMWMGGLTDHLCVETTGAMVIPFGVGNTRLLIQTLLDLQVDAIHCTPSYPAVLEQTIDQYFPGMTPRDLNLRLGLFGGEAALDQPAFRRRLEDTWGFKARNANYGMADFYCNFASQCEVNTDLHFLGHDVIYPELIDPESLETIPWQEGSRGELVLTHLARQAQPLVRFRTHDAIVITGTEPCECGRTTARFQILGRTDDMISVRGVNVFPAAVGGAIGEFSELSGEFCIRMKGKGPHDRISVEVEVSADSEATDELAARVENAIKFKTRASAKVMLVPMYALPRTEGKAKRLIREEEQ